MRPRLLTATGVASVLLLVSTGCGGSEQDYCNALQADQKTFSAMQEDTSGLALLRHVALLHRLAGKAPDDLSDEWQVLLGALDSFSHTLDEVGVSPADFVDGKPPAGLSAADRTKIANAADVLSSTDVVDAANGIEQQAKDVCKLQLGL